MPPNPAISHLFAQATQAHQAGQLEAARQIYERVLALAPAHADAHHLLGLICSQQERPAEAVAHLRQALALAGPNPIFYNNLGEVWRRQGALDQAIESYQQALRLAPTFAEAHYNLANVLKLQQRLPEAVHHYRQAITYKPAYASAHHNLGNTYLEQGRYRSAMACYQRCIELNPTFAEAHNNLGVTLREWDRLAEAIASYRRAVQLKPDFAAAQRNLALTLEKQGKSDEAKVAYRRLLDLEPDNVALRLHLDTLAPLIPESNEQIDRYRADLLAALDRHGPTLPLDLADLNQADAEPPSIITYHGRDDLEIKRKWAALVAGNFTPREPVASGGRPHVGFVVTHGHEGVFLKCMAGLINHLSGRRFKLTILCSGQIGEQVLRPAITNPAVGYLPLRGPFPEIVERIASARFDILHYWEVGTDATNYFLPFCRLAPVQCATWGWPVTSGIPHMDYFISSELLETEESDRHYSERLVCLKRLPTYYDRPPLSEAKPARSRFGLSDTAHLYLCQQNLRKVQPDFDPLAAEILRRDPQGQLLFIEDKEPTITGLLRQRLQRTMPDVIDRVRFLPRLPEADYLGLVSLADVILDTLHYSGGANTTYDALAAGTPIVTLPGRFHRGRYTAAAYRQIGLTECIAASPGDYIDLALRLGRDPAERARVSADIRAAGLALFEDEAAVRELADFFEGVLD